jgi:inner membrane protein
MDSLTQMVLGAAVGEAVLGRKLGNRAVLWGAIAGTVPDLDIIPGAFMSEIGGLGFHRGPTHSIVFSIMASFLFAAFAHAFYQKDWYNLRAVKWWNTIISGMLILLPFGLVYWLYDSLWGMLILMIFPFLSIWVVRRMIKNYVPVQSQVENPAYTSWFWMFFLAFVTHILLDCFTTYGTQLWLPFSNTRVAWNTISVIDPLYTLPFLGFLIAAMRCAAEAPIRRWLNFIGIGVSTLYLSFTVWNKIQVDNTLIGTLEKRQIEFQRFHSTPTMFNNALWYGLAETDSGYWYTYYSVFDESTDLLKWEFVQRSVDGTEIYEKPPIFNILNWFSDGYYTLKRDGKAYIWSDLRFGNMDFMQEGKSDSFVFYFRVYQKENGKWDISQHRPSPDTGKFFSGFYTRLKGLK